jgi:hypothetical protein
MRCDTCACTSSPSAFDSWRHMPLPLPTHEVLTGGASIAGTVQISSSLMRAATHRRDTICRWSLTCCCPPVPWTARDSGVGRGWQVEMVPAGTGGGLSMVTSSAPCRPGRRCRPQRPASCRARRAGRRRAAATGRCTSRQQAGRRACRTCGVAVPGSERTEDLRRCGDVEAETALDGPEPLVGVHAHLGRRGSITSHCLRRLSSPTHEVLPPSSLIQ